MTGNGAAGSATVLVVDDDSAMRMIVSLSLELCGYLALAAGSGEEALRLARDHPEIRVVILDVIMPGLSGKELAEQLKNSLPSAACRDSVLLGPSRFRPGALRRGPSFREFPAEALPRPGASTENRRAYVASLGFQGRSAFSLIQGQVG